MAKIRLLRRSNSYDKDAQSYRMILEVLSSENIKKEIFVNQRIRDFHKQNFNDVFVAIATPAQLADFSVNSPDAGTTYFLTSKVDVVSRNPDYLENVFNDIISNIQKLVSDFEALNILEADGIYTIEEDYVDVDMSIQHTHYRLPLVAQPCGLNEVYDDNGTYRHRVDAQDTNLEGWLNTENGDPAGYKFKYNIAKDSAVARQWPPDATKLAYAHIEVNGISQNNVAVLLNSNGIYWRENVLGSAPWPQDYVHPGNTGSAQYQLTLVLDFIV